jgi:hypothetical protein
MPVVLHTSRTACLWWDPPRHRPYPPLGSLVAITCRRLVDIATRNVKRKLYLLCK